MMGKISNRIVCCRTIQLQWKLDHTGAIFLESPLYKALYDNTVGVGYQACKYTNTKTNTQIHKYNCNGSYNVGPTYISQCNTIK